MRVVSFDHRDAYICFGWMFMRLFGSIPGAVIFGTVIDSTCLHWTAGSANTSKCVLYDASNLGYYIFLFSKYILLKLRRNFQSVYSLCKLESKDNMFTHSTHHTFILKTSLRNVLVVVKY
uniref:Solute carrier organic anion transporter family member 4A1 n=1 Tax=Heterorhabditis bacteriophora TaxID=37862 RepID=A0A1I7WJE6_HETBA